jgi:hypothetical protein
MLTDAQADVLHDLAYGHTRYALILCDGELSEAQSFWATVARLAVLRPPVLLVLPAAEQSTIVTALWPLIPPGVSRPSTMVVSAVLEDASRLGEYNTVAFYQPEYFPPHMMRTALGYVGGDARVITHSSEQRFELWRQLDGHWDESFAVYPWPSR